MMGKFAFAVASATAAVLSAVASVEAAEPLPIDYWAIRDSVSNVSVSPNGEWLALMKIETKDGDPIIEVYDTSDLSKPYKRLGASNMEYLPAYGLFWISDDKLYATAWDQVRRSVKRAEQDAFDYKALIYDVSEDEFTEVPGNFGIVSTMPTKPNKILVQRGRAIEGTETDPLANFRPAQYYELDLETGGKRLVFQGTREYPRATFDEDGNIRFTTGFDGPTDEVKYAYRSVGDNSWTVLKKVPIERDDTEFLRPVDFADDGGDSGLVLAKNGHDLTGLWEYDFAANEFGDLLFRPEGADIERVYFDRDAWDGNNRIVGVGYPGAKWERHYFDNEEEAFRDMLMSVIPNAHEIAITSSTRDGETMVVSNRGPKDPGTFYLLRDGQLAMLGSANPLLKAEDLHEVEYIKYSARDGRTIPAYVTYPHGEGPFPLVVMPHGGPYVTEVVGFDEWAQFLADQGYMVLQPQYRGSTGYGYEHFISSYGQHGYAMQDDKDDGALYLVERGLVDPDRMAMFGWSYGGYAAGVAASREDQIYQCAIAGAAVLDGMLFYNGHRNIYIPYADAFGAQRGAKSGINPINEVGKVNIPMMLVHGDLDPRVRVAHSENYLKALRKAGKDAKYVELDGAAHFFFTLDYDNQKELYDNLQSFLSEDCGPDGL